MTKFKVGDKVKYAYGGRNNVFVVVKVNDGEAYVAPEGIGMGADDGVPAKDSELSPLPKSAHNSVLNEKVRIGDTALRGATTATLDFAKDRRGDYILAGDEVIADAGDGIDTYEVLKVLPGNKVKIGGLGVEVATVDAKTVSVTRKHGILKRDGDTVVLKNALDYSNRGFANKATNSTNGVVANADRTRGRELMVKHMGGGFVQTFERENGKANWRKLVEDAKKVLSPKDASDIEAYIVSVVGNATAISTNPVVQNALKACNSAVAANAFYKTEEEAGQRKS